MNCEFFENSLLKKLTKYKNNVVFRDEKSQSGFNDVVCNCLRKQSNPPYSTCITYSQKLP